jgi:hypothetical protein
VDAAVIAAAVAVIGTLGAQYLAGRREERRERRRLDDARIDELRVVLDAAATDLHRALEGLLELVGELDGHTGLSLHPIYERFDEAVRGVDRATTRISIRLGEYHPLSDAFWKADTALTDARRALAAIRERPDWRMEPGESGLITESLGDAVLAQARFFEEASRLIGPERELGSTDARWWRRRQPATR